MSVFVSSSTNVSGMPYMGHSQPTTNTPGEGRGHRHHPRYMASGSTDVWELASTGAVGVPL
ncbi:MAG TPA: hypothetical protein VGM91_04155 [Conexibacter sp.]